MLPSFLIKGENDNGKRIIAPSEDNNIMLWDINQTTPRDIIDVKDMDKSNNINNMIS